MTSSARASARALLVLEALKEIRESQEKRSAFRVRRLTDCWSRGATKTFPDIAAKAASLGQVRDRVCVCTKCPHLRAQPHPNRFRSR